MTSVTSEAITGEGPGAASSPRGRRRTELTMLIFAVAVMAFGLANVGFSEHGRVPGSLLEYVAFFAVLMLGAHAGIRRLAPYADPLLLPLAGLLNGLGVVMMYRLQQASISGMPSSAAMKQLLFTAVGIVCFIAVLWLVREPRTLQRYTYTLGAAGLVLIALPAMLPGSISAVQSTTMNAKIQIRLGSFLTVQPEEFAKLALAVFFAGYLVAKRDVLALAGRRVLGIDLPRGRDMGPILVIWAVSLLLLVFESDVGTSALFMGLFVAMLYIATSRTSWLMIGFVLFVAGAFIASKLFAHVGERFDIWLHTFNSYNMTHNSYQLVKGLEGLGSGGLLGRGLGAGQPFYTPLVQSDFVITAFGEEIGLAGLMAILLVYGLLIQRGLRAAVAVKDPFAKLLAGGLSFMIALQVFVIVGGVTRVIPLTGITTPFLSEGGSSLVASWMLIALLARVSDAGRRPAPRPIQDEGLTQVVSLS